MGEGVSRDHDAAGRARNARPRDALGRPLPYGSADASPDLDVDAARTPDETLDTARRLLAAGYPFAAHEVLESAWKRSQGRERDVWRALAQLAVGVTHAARGNRDGALTLLARARTGLEAHSGETFYGLPLDDVRERAEALRVEVAAGRFHPGAAGGGGSGGGASGGVGALLGGDGEVVEEAVGHPLEERGGVGPAEQGDALGGRGALERELGERAGGV